MKKVFVVIVSVLLISGVLLAGCVNNDDKDMDKPPQTLPEEEPTDFPDQPSTPSEPDENSDTSPQEILEGIAYYEFDVPMEDFEAIDLTGQKVKLSDYKGKIVFLNFWGTWCPPCRGEMPHMEEFYKEYKEKEVVLLAVSPTSVELRGGNDAEEAEKRVRDFIESNGYTFPVLLDKDDEAWAIYQQSGVPANYIIDREGIIRYLKIGAFSGKEEMELFVKAIEAMQN